MLDPRIYRAAFLPLMLAILVVAFSLEDRPRAIGTTLAPDAFQGPLATTTLEDLAQRFPDRRPGSAGDDALAARVASRLRVLGPGTVRSYRSKGQTIDGERRLTTVIGTRPGQPGPQLVVVAHRDAAGRGAKAELSATAALLELARVAADGRLRRTITFVSTSGGTGGATGARAAIRHLRGSIDAILVLGDLASEKVRKPFVVSWSNREGVAPLRLRRTVEAAAKAEAGTDPGGPRAVAQWARLAFPLTTSEVGAFGAAGLPAVMLSVSGERVPAADAPLAEGRLDTFGRAALRAIFALDNGPDVASGPSAVIVTQRKVLPGWAVRLLVLALLLPMWLATVDGLARANRRHSDVGRWLRWLLATVLPFALTAAFAVLEAMVGLISAAPRAPAPAGAIPIDGIAFASIVLVFAIGWLVVRPLALRVMLARPPAGHAEGGGPAAATLVAFAAAALAIWIANPFAAALLVPAAHLWLLAVAPEVRLRRGVALALVLAALLPFAAVALIDATQLGYSPGEVLWTGVLLVAGGHVGALTWLVWSVVAGCGVAAGLIALHPPDRDEPGAQDVTVRGPLTYAGPGSLGGTESALRR